MTIDQKEETIRILNAKLLFPPKPKIEYKVRERLYQRCAECDIKQVKQDLSVIENDFIRLFCFTIILICCIALKNSFFRRDICFLAVSFSGIVCKCADKINALFKILADTANEIENQTAEKVVHHFIYFGGWLIFIVIFVGILWFLSYLTVQLFNKYWKGVYNSICVLCTAVVIVLFDTQFFEKFDINTILLSVIFSAISITVFEILRAKGIIYYE